jgi:hypothetical protein
MKIEADFSALKGVRWYEYALRFVAGGTITVITGILAQRYGPLFGGLFLAFPAIFPASATLVEKHENKKKKIAGIPQTSRGRLSAALDARGATLGAIGLACFALVVWRWLPRGNAALVLILALATWMALSLLIWRLWKARHALFSPNSR